MKMALKVDTSELSKLVAAADVAVKALEAFSFKGAISFGEEIVGDVETGAESLWSKIESVFTGTPAVTVPVTPAAPVAVPVAPAA